MKIRPLLSSAPLTEIENGDAVAAFLRDHPEFRRLPFPNPLDGRDTDGTLWIWPWTGPCNGMFIAQFARAANGRKENASPR